MGGVDVPALRGITMSVGSGEFLAVLGPSGSGKSTLFHIIGGLTPPTSGKVVIDGRNLGLLSDSERTELRKTMVGFVFQKFNLLPTLSASENIEIARHIAGNTAGNDESLKDALDILGVAHRLNHKPLRAFRRRAAARRHRPRDRQQAAHPAGGRAHRKPRFAELGRGARYVEEAQSLVGSDGAHDYAQCGGRGVLHGAHLAHERRPDRLRAHGRSQSGSSAMRCSRSKARSCTTCERPLGQRNSKASSCGFSPNPKNTRGSRDDR